VDGNGKIVETRLIASLQQDHNSGGSFSAASTNVMIACQNGEMPSIKILFVYLHRQNQTTMLGAIITLVLLWAAYKWLKENI
jgi:hypothetical protein